MIDEVFYPLFFGILLYFGLFISVTVMNDDFAFNLKANYERWYELNWFGVWFFTILYWIAFLPFTIIALIYWLFTVGRK
jgi:hypothetical protein